MESWRRIRLSRLAHGMAVPNPLEIRLPLAYPVARHDLEMTRYLATWIDLRRKDGTIKAFYEHWILGRNAVSRTPRWSILRNVLHVGNSSRHAGP